MERVVVRSHRKELIPTRTGPKASAGRGHSKKFALYANPLFWQYGLFAFVSRCCAHNNQHRRQIASAAKAALTKQDKSGEKDVDALTFMQTVVMSYGVWRTNAAHQ